MAVLGILFLLTAAASLPGAHVQTISDPAKTSLVAMTMNVQGFNDKSGERSYDRQIALIQRASPDILTLQETDTNRISFNNNDYVRYFAEKLGYFAYYGPTPITGTYGTTILSKYPLENTRSVFMYSDTDETGLAEAEVEIGGAASTVYDVHPDSSDPAMVAFAQTLLARSNNQPNVIAMGDYNCAITMKPIKSLTRFIPMFGPAFILPKSVKMAWICRARTASTTYSSHLI